jgi:hypothetical protein
VELTAHHVEVPIVSAIPSIRSPAATDARVGCVITATPADDTKREERYLGYAGIVSRT